MWQLNGQLPKVERGTRSLQADSTQKRENPHAVSWTINSGDIQLSAVAGKQPGI